MVQEIHGKAISAIYWPDTASEKMRCMYAGVDGVTLTAWVSGFGEFWIVKKINGKEVGLINPRYVEEITWKEEQCLTSTSPTNRPPSRK